MANKRWKGGAGAVAQVSTLTVGGTPQLAAPSQPILTPNTSGGTLAAGTYQVIITYTNAAGETTGSPSNSATTTGSTGEIVSAGSSGIPQVRCGQGCTLTTLDMEDGSVLLENAPTTIDKYGGSLTVMAGNVTTWNEYGGGSAYLGTGNIGTLVASAVIDFSQDPRGRTVTNATFHAGGGFHDPQGTVAWTNPFLIAGLLSDMSLVWKWGAHIALT